jgi:hypothetical protein
MRGELIKIHPLRENKDGKYRWLEFKMQDGSIKKTWVFYNSKNYERMWKHIIGIGVGVRLKNLQVIKDDLIHPNSDMFVIPAGMGWGGEDSQIEEVEKMGSLIGEVLKIHPAKKSRNGNTFQRIEFILKDRKKTWVKTDVCPDFRNYKKWKPVIEAGVRTRVDGLSLKDENTVDADSDVVVLQKKML